MKIRQSQISPVFREPSAGDLNQRLMLRKVSEIPANDFSTEKTYLMQSTCWGKVIPLAAVLHQDGAQIENKVTHKALIRYRLGLGHGWEVQSAGVIYRVKGAQPLNGRTQFTLLSLEELHGN
ncbi:MAG: phage head closure protein [Plesiomonas sp.]|uniref:phage head closure protein n=1 Tax=Plesiomonas sp. TaxID=2486279 RepID=UPI003F3E428E